VGIRRCLLPLSNWQKMTYKLIALDLDGTLLSDDGSIHKENIRQLVRFSKNGGIVVLSSGRMTDCIVPFTEVLGIDCPIIAYNGAMARLKKAEERRIIYHSPLSYIYADEIIDYCIENNFFLNFYLAASDIHPHPFPPPSEGEDEGGGGRGFRGRNSPEYLDVLYASDREELRRYADIYSRQTGAVYHFIKDISVMKGKSPTKLILITDVENEDKRRTRDFQYEFFKNRFSDGTVKVMKTNPEYLEFINGNTDKGVALRKLSEYYKIPEEQIIAMGDGHNDIDMLEYAGISAVPANAKDEVKRVADVVLKWDNNNAAVGNFLKEIL